MRNDNFYLTLSARFEHVPDKICLEGPGFPSLSYGELQKQVNALAQSLSALNLEKGDRVLVQVYKSPAAVILYLACLHQGLIFVPVNPAYTDQEMDYFLGNASPTLLVTEPDRLEKQTLLARQYGVTHCLTLDASGLGSLYDLNGHDDSQLAKPTHCASDDIAVLIYTSGTTGKPKGAMLSHRNLMTNALTLSSFWGWQSEDVLIHALPVFHVHGLFIALHLPLINGSSMKFLKSFSAKAVLDLLPCSTVLMGVPTFYTRLLEEPELDTSHCSNMRLFISGSAPLLPETFEAFEKRTGHRILERYGMSEAGMLVSNPLNGERVPGTVGFPLPDVSTRICSDDGNQVAQGEIGTLEVKGPNIFRGYWKQPDKTMASFHEDFFITGDLACADDKGRISIVGRSRDMVITGGLNVYPREVEEALNSLEGVEESAVFGVPHPDLGEGLVAMIVISKGTEANSKNLLSSVKMMLSGYKIPKKLIFSKKLPRNTMGKVQKAELRRQYADLFTS